MKFEKKISRKGAKAQRKTQRKTYFLLCVFLCVFAPLRERNLNYSNLNDPNASGTWKLGSAVLVGRHAR